MSRLYVSSLECDPASMKFKVWRGRQFKLSMHIGMSLQTVTIVMKDSNKLECYITKKEHPHMTGGQGKASKGGSIWQRPKGAGVAL